MSQSKLNKITTRRTKNVSVETIVCLCLALKLSPEEAIDYLARKERTFSPAKPEHKHYMELIKIYSADQSAYASGVELSSVLDRADEYLLEKGFLPLPNFNLN